MVSNGSLRASLASSKQEVVSQSEIINALSRDMALAHARLSDMTGATQSIQHDKQPRSAPSFLNMHLSAGELSEQQKLELESHKALVIDQRIQLSTLTNKLSMMSQLVQQKDKETKMLGEKLRYG